jgi:hypothetical protein
MLNLTMACLVYIFGMEAERNGIPIGPKVQTTTSNEVYFHSDNIKT